MSTKAPHPILLFLNSKKEKLVAAVPHTLASTLPWESIVQGVAVALEDPKSGPKLGACTPESVYGALITILRLGLDPAPIRGQAYLVPRGRECTALIGSRGKIELAYRSGRVTKIVAQCVYATDEVEIDLANGEIHHRLTKAQLLDDTDPGPPIAAYARIWLKGVAEPITELMRSRDINKIRAVATKHGESPAWRDFPDEMAKRSVLSRALKRAPSSAELMEAIRDVDIEERPVSLHADVIDNEPTPAALPDYGTSEEIDAELSRMADPVAAVVPTPTPPPPPASKPTPQKFDDALPAAGDLRTEIAALEKRIPFEAMRDVREKHGILPLKPLDSRLGEAKLTAYRDALRAKAGN